jgi:capsular exopolysaccharide synthesis family protein
MSIRGNMQEDIHLKQYLWTLYKRRWTIVTFLTCVVAIAAVYSFTQEPVYKGTAQIIIEKENPNIVDFKEIYAVDASSQDFFMTQYNILQSRFLAKNVVERLGLDNDLKHEPAAGGQNPGILSSILFWRKKRIDSKEDLVSSFLDGLEVEPVRNTRIVKISYYSGDPSFAAEAANTVVSAYSENILDSKIEAVHGATDFLQKKIDEQRKKLEESELLLQQYKEEFNIISLGDKENITVAKLAELNSDVLRAENARVEAEMRYRQAKAIEDMPDMIESIPKVLSNPLITRLKGEEAKILSDLSERSKKYGEKHPKRITYKEKLRTNRESLDKEIKKLVKFLKNEYDVALAKESTLKGALDEQKAQSQQLNKLSIAYGVLLRDVDANKQMYEILLTRLKQAGITGGIQSTIVRVLDRAVAPTVPVRPNRAGNIIVALVFGLMGGVGIAFFLEYLDNTVKTPDDLSRYFQIPYLGPVPNYEDEISSEGGERPLVMLRYPMSAASEAYRGIRTAIVFSSSIEREKKTILITSTGPSEGKTVTAANLAVTIAQSGARTLLVDADFRRPSLHRMFGLPRDTGYSNVIVGKAGLDEAIKATSVPKLDVMTSGHMPPNPAELFGSESMRNTIKVLKERYDHIIFDSPPVLGVTDPVILSTEVDMVLMVINTGKVAREAVHRSVEQLADVGANLAGAILNRIRVGKDSYYYYQYSYQQYGKEEDTDRASA